MSIGGFVQSKTASPTGTGSAVVMNAAPADGNLLVAFSSWSGTSVTATANTGWALGTALSGDDSAVMAYKLAGAGESATQTPFALSGGGATKDVAICEYLGPWLASPLDVQAAQDQPGATYTSPGVDPADGVSRLVVGAAYNSKNSATWSNQKVAGSTGGVTERVDFRGTNTITMFDRVGGQ